MTRLWVRLGQTAAAGLVSAVFVASGVALTAHRWDGPFFHIAGGRLRGPVHAGPEPDWAELAGVGTVELEVDPDNPHSVLIGIVELGGRVFVPATLRPAEKRWAQTLMRDGRARLRVDGQVFRRHARRIEDPVLLQALIERALEKYRPSYFVPEATWFFELLPPA